MALSDKHLGTGEQVILVTRTHAKALILPILVFLLVCLATGAAIAVLPATWPSWSVWIVVGLALVLAGWGSFLPFLRWWTSTFTLTNRRIVMEHGILTKVGHDLPLVRVNNVEYERGLVDRMLGCGTLTLTTAADEPLVLTDIPDITRVHQTMTDLLFGIGLPATAESGEDN